MTEIDAFCTLAAAFQSVDEYSCQCHKSVALALILIFGTIYILLSKGICKILVVNLCVEPRMYIDLMRLSVLEKFDSERCYIMCIVVPFRAVRPVKAYVRDVASYPYDIVDSKEARAIAKGNPRSFLHIVKSEIDLPLETDIYDEKVYEKARDNFRRLSDEGILFQDATPCFYVYRQQMGDHMQFGIVACASIKEYETVRIKKHELTRSDKEYDRTKHIDILNAQTGPVFLTYQARAAIDEIVRNIVCGTPEYDFVATDGISHTVWVVDDTVLIEKIREEFLTVENFYIADGHHRAASSATVAKMRKRQNPDHDGSEEYNYMMAVIFPHDQLKIMAYNRVVADLNKFTETEFLDRVRQRFLIFHDVKGTIPACLHEFGMYLHGTWYLLRAKESVYIESDIIGALDVSILHDHLLTPILGIGDPRTDERINFVGGIRGVAELERLVDSGQYAVAFSIYPTTVHQLMDVADSSNIMPPKSTWFEPKLRSGLFVHLMD